MNNVQMITQATNLWGWQSNTVTTVVALRYTQFHNGQQRSIITNNTHGTASVCTDHCMEPVELHVDSKPEPGHSAVCIELSKHHTLTVTHYTASCTDVPNVVATRHTLQRPKSLPAAVTASASWECGATWWMWLYGQVSSIVTYDCLPDKIT